MPKKTIPRAPVRVAVDTGGTFTDCVWIEDGRLKMLKVFSTPDDPSWAIAEAVKKIAGRDPVTLLHGTTVGTNAVLERKGARVAFITTQGFEDAIEIGRQARPKLYDFFFERIPPLVLAPMRFGVAERTRSDGSVEKAPQAQELESLAQRVAKERPQSIAVSLLFSFANPANELSVAEAFRGLKVPLSLSHQILPEFREYERSSTTVMNAYLQPVLEKYLENLRKRITNSTVFVMQSSGGIASLVASVSEPVRTVLSGPAGGVVGATAVGKRLGSSQLITFDMGGTSTDVALVSGEPKPTNEGEIAGLPVRVPMLDIHTVGAGGGSIARFDAGGALRVGPESAGAEPGPICYGRGEEPTVTDANLLLGRLRPEDFLGGGFRLDLERTREVVRQWLARQASAEARKMRVEQFAEGVLGVVNANMEKAVRVVSIERGNDPRNFSLVAFGGAGPLHGAALASALSITHVIVPAMPGALSAYGILVSDVVRDFSKTVLLRVSAEAAQDPGLEPVFTELERTATAAFKAEGWREKPVFARSVDVRYRGQGFELNVPFSSRLLTEFHAEHRKRYGYSHPDRDVELVTVRLRATIPTQVKIKERKDLTKNSKPRYEQVWFGGRKLKTEIWRREGMGKKKISGPAIVTEYSATAVVPPNWSARVAITGDLILNSEQKTKRRPLRSART
jgi:N-methylhydantoinase A